MGCEMKDESSKLKAQMSKLRSKLKTVYMKIIICSSYENPRR